MKKVFCILTLLLLTSGCVRKNGEYFDNIAETAISFFRVNEYDTSKFDKNDRKAIDTFLSEVTHNNQVVNISNYIDLNKKTNEKNTVGINIVDGQCYMDYSLIKNEFDKIENGTDPEREISYVVVCNGYYATLYPELFYPDYSVTQKDPVHNYVLLTRYKENGDYIYIYRSTYNGLGLKVTLNTKNKVLKKIDITNVNADNYIKK